jgi:hypothetical protein
MTTSPPSTKWSKKSKRDVSVDGRSIRHPENCCSTDFKTGLEEKKTVLNIFPARTDTRGNGRAIYPVPGPVKHD